MSVFTRAEEERVRTAARAKDWMDSGLLDAQQHSVIQAALSTDLKRTNLSLRVVLFIFGSIVLWAAWGLFAVRAGHSAFGWSMVAAGVAAALLAEVLVASFRLYRFGVEEAFASSSVVMIGCGAASLVTVTAGSHADRPMLVGLLVATAVSGAVYMRFGYRYAAFVAVAGAAIAPFFLGQSSIAGRCLSASILAVVFIAAGRLERPHREDFPGDDYAAVRSAAWLGLYLVLNLRLAHEIAPFMDASRAEVPSSLYWGTYALVWLLPAAGLYLGLVDKHRGMIVSSLVMAVLTLVTNKTYLGWERHTWDPILLGLLLAGTAIALRRWLSRGTDGQRHGFTAASLLDSDRESIAALSAAAGMVKPLDVRQTPPAFEPGSGGRSGGGGGGADF